VILAIQYREILEGSRSRNMLIPKLCEAVVSGYEQIVTGDVVVLLEWGPVTLHGQGQHVPLFLRDRIESPPGLQRTKMNRLGLHLGESAGEFRMRSLLPVAHAIPVVEGYFTHRRPAVREADIGFILGHTISYLRKCPV
jgi:hypothetical protein